MDNLDSSDSISHTRSFEPIAPRQEGAPSRGLGLFQRIFKVFLSEERSHEEMPARKICFHQENADKVRQELERAKKELQAELDHELLPLITEVIDPMLRDVERINRLRRREQGQDLASIQFHEWTESAKLWVELFSKKWDKQAVKKEIVRHIIDKSFQKIEKDIRFIESYFEQYLGQLGLSPEETQRVRMKKGKRLSEYLEKMRALKTPPEKDLKLEESLSWRFELDEKRAKLHDDALHIIDARL